MPNVEKQVQTYFELLDKIKEAKKVNDMDKVFMFSQMSLGLLGALIEDTKKHSGSFDIVEIPALDEGFMIAVVREEKIQIQNFKEVVSRYKELKPWKTKFEEIEKLSEVVDYIKSNSGCLQKDLKKTFDLYPYLLARCTIYLEVCGLIRREKVGNTLRLVWSGSEGTKECQFCGEEILSIAIKCKHCGEFLNKSDISLQNSNRSNEPEKTLWEEHPSHLYYLFAYIIGGILILIYGLGLLLDSLGLLIRLPIILSEIYGWGLPIGLPIALFALLNRKSKVFTITNKRVRSKVGIVSRSIHEVFIKDVRSVNLHQGILERLFGLGSINIGSAGTAGVEVSFKGISQPLEIKEKIQKLATLAAEGK